MGIVWKGQLVLDDVLDHTFLAGKMGEHFELKLLDHDDTPMVPVVVRQIDRMKVELVGRDELPKP